MQDRRDKVNRPPDVSCPINNGTWGPVRCKQAGGYGVSRKKYEFDDLARIARETGLSLPELLEKLP